MLARHRELIDCHARLQHASYEGQRGAVVARAARAGVTQIVCSSVSDHDWSILLDLAAAESSVLPCFGWDPAHIADRPRDWLHKLQLVMQTGRAAVGMVGLDRSQRRCAMTEQVEVLRAQLALAGQRHCPVVLRSDRDSVRVLDILDGLEAPPSGVLWYGFTGPVRLVEPLVRLGVYFAYAGDLLSHKSPRIRRACRAVPLDRLLLATDAPGAMPPAPYAPYQLLDADQHRVNEPANLPHIIDGVASWLDQDADQLAQLLTHNALCLFGSMIPSEL